MSSCIRFIVLIISILPVAGQVFSQVQHNYRASTVKSFKARLLGDDISNPVLELGSTDRLLVDFDDLSDQALNLDYTIIHCGPTWEKTDLLYSEFATGFEFNNLLESRSSQGTGVLYTHYTLELPNRDVQWLLTGNYILQIVDSYEHTQIIAEQRFTVVEPKTSIQCTVVQTFSPTLKDCCQQIKLSINHARLGIADPFTELFVVITQNNQLYNAKIDPRPTFQSGNSVSYDAPDSLVFGGGYEYRNLVYRSGSYQSAQIVNRNRLGGEWHLNLAPDFNNNQRNYSAARDINGRFILKRDDCTDTNIEGDYQWFYFNLPAQPVANAEVYIFGELSGWELAPAFRLNYNFATRAYEGRLLLKHGIYNYRYVLVDSKLGKIDHEFFEGNYFATENSYQVYVYHRPQDGRYWQAVGYKEVTVNK